MWWKQSESIHFDWIMTDLFSVCWEYENALTDWSDEKWGTKFKQKIADRGYSDEIQEFVQKELERFLPLWMLHTSGQIMTGIIILGRKLLFTDESML